MTDTIENQKKAALSIAGMIERSSGIACNFGEPRSSRELSIEQINIVIVALQFFGAEQESATTEEVAGTITETVNHDDLLERIVEIEDAMKPWAKYSDCILAEAGDDPEDDKMTHMQYEKGVITYGDLKNTVKAMDVVK